MSVELARTVRSGLVESRHEGSAVAVRADGEVLARWGDPDERLFYRSAIKPLQATVAQEHGAALVPEQMAMACASHAANPVQVALVRTMLSGVELEVGDLACPASLPGSPRARQRLGSIGPGTAGPLYHPCSGKHASFLRACRAAGWPTASYLDPAHPLQVAVVERVGAITGIAPDPVGVDGCGAPTPSGSITGLARAFARMTVESEYVDARTAMDAYPALLSDNQREVGKIGAWWGGPVKSGAEGLFAAGRNGVGIAVKSREGSTVVAAIAIIAVMRHLGMLSDAGRAALASVAEPAVMGGGRRVGGIVAVL